MNDRSDLGLLAISVVSALAFLTAATGLPSVPGQVRSKKAELVELEVKDVLPLAEAHSHAVLLVAGDGTVLPVFVDEAAAIAIAFRLARRQPPHALAEDLLDQVVKQMGGKVVRVRIGAVQNNLEACTVEIQQGERTVSLAARPSDSIALALSSGAKILVAPQLLASSGITPREIEQLRSQLGIGGSGPQEKRPRTPPSGSEFSL